VLAHVVRYQVWQQNRALSVSTGVGPLTADEVREVLGYPRAAVAAMPFLRTQEQVDMHRLLMKYSLGRGEAFQQAQDRKSQDPTKVRRLLFLVLKKTSCGRKFELLFCCSFVGILLIPTTSTSREYSCFL